MPILWHMTCGGRNGDRRSESRRPGNLIGENWCNLKVIMKRRSFFALPAGLCALPAAEPRPPAGRPFQLGCVTYNVLKDMDLERSSALSRPPGSRRSSCGPGTSTASSRRSPRPSGRKVRERFQASKVKLLSYGTTCEFQSPDDAAAPQADRDSPRRSSTWPATPARSRSRCGRTAFPTARLLGATIQRIGAGLHEVGEYGQVERHRDLDGGPRAHHAGAEERRGDSARGRPSERRRVLELESDGRRERLGEAELRPARPVHPQRPHQRAAPATIRGASSSDCCAPRGTSGTRLCEAAESKEPERFLSYYKALWEQLTA